MSNSPPWADLPAYRAAYRDRMPVPDWAPPELATRRQWVVWRYEPGETPEECGRKELREETGFQAVNMVSLGIMLPSVGFCNEVIHLFLATDLTEVGKALEPEERIETFSITLEEARARLNDQGYPDGKTHVILHRALNHLALTR